MKTKKILITGKITLITLILIALIKCVNDPLIGLPHTDSRDYEWTIDTLREPYGYITRLWGSTPTDVWAVSPGSNGTERILYFNGNEWSNDGVYRYFSPRSVWGFFNKDVWIAGSNGQIWHYGGSDWRKVEQFTKDGSDRILFADMWGDQQYGLFAFGAYPDDESGDYMNPVITHRLNNKWEFLNTEGVVGIVRQLYVSKKTDKLYIQVIKWGNAYSFDSTQIYEYNNEKFDQLYSSAWETGYTADIALIEDEVYFILGSRIAIRKNNEFQTVFTIDHPKFYGQMWGRNIDDIFVEMSDGIAHYNGTDLIYLHHFSKQSTRIFDTMLFDDDVFFAVAETNTLIYRRKKKE